MILLVHIRFKFPFQYCKRGVVLAVKQPTHRSRSGEGRLQTTSIHLRKCATDARLLHADLRRLVRSAHARQRALPARADVRQLLASHLRVEARLLLHALLQRSPRQLDLGLLFPLERGRAVHRVLRSRNLRH